MRHNDSSNRGIVTLEHGATAAMRAYAQPNETEAESIPAAPPVPHNVPDEPRGTVARNNQ